MPSNNIDNCAGISDTAPSRADGQMTWPSGAATPHPWAAAAGRASICLTATSKHARYFNSSANALASERPQQKFRWERLVLRRAIGGVGGTNKPVRQQLV